MPKRNKNMKFLTTCNVAIITASCCANSVFAADFANHKINVNGYIMLDYDNFNSAFLENNEQSDSQFDIRRARFSVKAKPFDNWKAKLQVDLSAGDFAIKDAYLQYSGWQWADITLGKQKEPFGLEQQISSRNLLMLERSISTEAISPSRSTGISVAGTNQSFLWKLGYFQPNESESASAITGRFVWLPWQQKNEVLHLGASFSERDYNNSEFRINERMEVSSADSLIEGKKLTAQDISLRGLELLWIKNHYTLMAEWQQANVLDSSQTHYDYQGGYIQMSYQLSGGHRKYNKGELAKVSKNGWELTSRFSDLSLSEENKSVTIYSVGVNYTVNKNTKFMADILRSNNFKNNTRIDAGNALSLRLQYSF
jgi:phosphate-selective porin OprO/OprP